MNSSDCVGVSMILLPVKHTHSELGVFGVIPVAFRSEIKRNNMSRQDLEFLSEVLIANWQQLSRF